MEWETDRKVTHAIPTTEMDCEVIHAISMTERDQEVIHLVKMIIRGEAMKPLFMTITGTHDNFHGQFAVLKRFQNQRPGKLNDFAETCLMVQLLLAIRCRQHVSEIDLNELPSRVVKRLPFNRFPVLKQESGFEFCYPVTEL